MTNVRLFFSKTGEARYLSHLDMMRCFTRAIKCSGLEAWYTQGFNTHMYLMFACPLSLGYESKRETLDLRLVNDEDAEKDVAALINKSLPGGIRIFEVAEPVMKHTEIEYSLWNIVFRGENSGEAETIREKLGAFFAQEEIPVLRKTKRGEKTENAVPLIRKVSWETDGNACILHAMLSQNVERALNPKVLLNAFTEFSGVETDVCEITREEIYDAAGRAFR